jgi:hypothetical protein
VNLRWLFGNYADPEFRLTRRQQHEVTWLAHRKYLSSRRLALWTASLAIGSLLAAGFGHQLLAVWMIQLGIPYPRTMSYAAIAAAAVVSAAWMYRFIYIGPVRQAMRELGYDLCLECGYRLQGLSDDVTHCPECGSAREPRQPSTATPMKPPANQAGARPNSS